MRALYNGFFSRFGLPRQLHSDQGRNFESRLVAELCKITGVYKTRTTPFHPRSDGQTERANRTILQMLRTTAEDNPADWPNRLPAILAAYRMTPHSSTGVSPNKAMLGREVLLPCTLIAAPPEADPPASTSFAQSFRDTLREAHHTVRQNLHATARTQKQHFDARIRPHTFHLGQKVWLFWPRPVVKQQAHKLTQLWTGPWDIISIKSDLIVEIQDPTSRKKQTVHVDRLLPCQQLASETQSPAARPTRLRSPPRRRPTVEPDPATMEHQSVSAQPSLPSRRSSRLRRAPPYLHSYV